MSTIVNQVEVQIPVGAVGVAGLLMMPADAHGIVVFVHGSGSSRLSPRNQLVAQHLVDHRCGAMLFDLLTASEELDRRNVFDIPLLSDRVLRVTEWLHRRPETGGRPVGYFGASTGAAAAIVAAAREPSGVAAVVSRGGRPDLAGDALERLEVPVLLLVGSRDQEVVRLNRAAAARLHCPHRLDIIEGATHLFPEPGTLQLVEDAAAAWFLEHFPAVPAASGGS